MKRRSPMTKPMRRPGRLERLDSDWNRTAFSNSLAGGLEHAVGLRPRVDFRIAFVAEQQKAEAPRHRGQALR